MSMRLKLDARLYYRDKVYVDVSESDLFNLRKKMASRIVGRTLEDEEIRRLDSEPSHISGLDYSRKKDRYCCLEFFRHSGNGRRGSIAYFAGQKEALVEDVR